MLGSICTLGLAYSAVGFDFNFLDMLIGSLTICMITTMLGVILVAFTFEFLKFCLYSLPFIIVFVNLPLLDYLGVVDIAYLKHFSPIQPSLDILVASLQQDQQVSLSLQYFLSFIWVLSIYILAYKLFNKKVLNV